MTDSELQIRIEIVLQRVADGKTTWQEASMFIMALLRQQWAA